MVQKKASQVIWDWRNKEKGGGHQAKPSLAMAGIGLVVGGSVAALFFVYGHHVMMGVVLAISLGIFCCALFFPKAYQAIQVGLQRLSFVVGQVLTWLLLTPFFYLVFSFGRLVQKIFHRDPMTREWQPDRESYWVDRAEVTDTNQYRRQS